MKVGVVKETFPGERRVALIPDSIPMLVKGGHEVMIQAGAGVEAGYLDKVYEGKGARIVADRAELFCSADAIIQIRGLGSNKEAGRADLELFEPDQVLVAMLDPLGEPESVKLLAERKVRAFSLELMPRITRAQSMDVLSSMATVAGYKAVILAADTAPRMFPMYMTAAGTITAARAFVIGAGVAGLQAIATAKRLGAIVSAYDVRPAVKEQIESLGAKFVEMPLETTGAEDKGGYAKEMGDEFLRKQRELMKSVVEESLIIITTAAIPGKKSPVLITADMIQAMQPGSVIVDLAAERGGNCEGTKADQTVVTDNGVTILGPTNLPSTIPYHASQMFSRNIVTFLKELTKDGKLALDMSNEVHHDTMLTDGGEVVHARVREALGLPPKQAEAPAEPATEGQPAAAPKSE